MDPRVVGGTYRSGYWGQTYKVLAREPNAWVTWYGVRWEDGRETVHCTDWDSKRDSIVEVLS